MTTCSICGGRTFHENRVLWPALIAEWELSPDEVAYIDRQQGCACTACGANLRAIALGQALQAVFGTDAVLDVFVDTPDAAAIRLLEVNEAHVLSAPLRRLPGHVLASYPDVDLTRLPYADGSFDVVVHSDTLEHVPDPLQGLRECRRVLRPGGALCFTVPMVVGRLSRSRAGLPPSFHGDAATGREDFLVHTEFGADAWTLVAQAGFERIGLTPVAFPAAVAITAVRDDDGVAARESHERRDAMAERIADLQREILALRSSTSWSVTMPLRMVARWWNSLRGR